VIPARMLDTLIGVGIAWLAGWLLLPTWQGRQWPQLAATALRAQAGYLREIVAQWSSGKRDHLAYRTARRNAHNADAALSNAYAAMLKEPRHARLAASQCGDFLILSHTLLNYLSALGAHRDNPGAGLAGAQVREDAETLCEQLLAMADGIVATKVPPLAMPPSGGTDQAPLGLALRLLPELRQQAALMVNAGRWPVAAPPQ